VDFDNLSSQYVAVAPDSEFEVADGSIQFWFNTEDAGRDQTLFAKDHKGTGAGQLRIGIDSRDLVVALESSSKTFTIDTNGTKFNDPVKSNTWYQLTFTFGHDGMKLFLDGMLIGTNTYTGGLTGNHEAIVIGGSNESNTDASGNLAKLKITNPADAAIDEVALFATALTVQQIQQTRDRGPMGVVRPEDLGTIDGTDTLISIESTIFSASPAGAATPTLQTLAAPTVTTSGPTILMPTVAGLSSPVAQPNVASSTPKPLTIDWSSALKSSDSTAEQSDSDQQTKKTRSAVGWVMDFVTSLGQTGNANSELRVTVPAALEATKKTTSL
jgi:hypothetical protein